MIPVSPMTTVRHFQQLQPQPVIEPDRTPSSISHPHTCQGKSTGAKISDAASSTVTMLPGASAEVAAYASQAGSGMHTPAQQVSQIVAEKLRKEWGLAIDPDRTKIVTLNYDLSEPKPADGKVLNEITLTQAALSNERSMNRKDEHQSPSGRLLDELAEVGEKIPFSPFLTAFSTIKQAKDVFKPIHEYIMTPSGSKDSATYSLEHALAHKPQAFRDLVWNTELIGPYKSYLDSFWATHEKTYSKLGQIAFAQAVHAQVQEGSLNQHEAALAMQAAGLPSGKAWPDMKLADFQAPYSRPATIEVGLLGINGDLSTDLVYVLDKNPKLDADGKKLTTTLLYIPGNSSPIHRFDSPEAMKEWLAEQAADPVKRAALQTHFTRSDQDTKTFSDGVSQSLAGLGGWRQSQTPNALGFTGMNAWDPQRYVSLEPQVNNPFEAVTQRQKQRSYDDADHDITTDRDVIKSKIVNGAEALAASALMMTPLAILMPEIALALDALYVGAGVAEVAVGIDDVAKGKSTGADRIVFGVLNAAPGIAQGTARGAGRLLETEAEAGEKAVTSAPGVSGEPSGADVKEIYSDEAKQTGRQRIRLDTSMRDLQLVDDSFFTFVDTYKGADRLNIVVHGRELGYLEKKYNLPTDVMLDGFSSTPEELQDRLWGDAVYPEEYDNVRLVMCYSGNGGEESFAAKFHQLIGKPVKAYVGPVEALFNSRELRTLYEEARASRDSAIGLEQAITEEDQPLIVKDGMKYEPVHFPPRPR